MLPHHEGKTLNRKDMIHLLNELDTRLKGSQNKVKLYCLGGTFLVLSNLRDSSKDADFLLSQKDFIKLSSHISQMEWKENVRVDLFPEGELPDYRYGDYQLHSNPAPINFANIELYYLDKADLILTKALAGRADDYKDIKLITASKGVPDIATLKDRYQRITPAPGKEARIRKNFEKFIEKFYQNQ